MEKQCPVPKVDNLITCFYSSGRKMFECDDGYRDWDLDPADADEYIAHPPKEYQRILEACLNQ